MLDIDFALKQVVPVPNGGGNDVGGKVSEGAEEVIECAYAFI
jgi:hypothetical protein